jgi:uncharacterized protein (TIGR00251 family)
VSGSTRIALRVSPGGSYARVVGRHGGAWKVRVAAPPEGGKANDAVVALLATVLELSQRDVTLVSGHGARDKIVALAGIDSDETERRLLSAAGLDGKEAA